VLVNRMQKPVLKALDYAIAARHESLEAVHVSIDDEATALLQRQWADQNIEVPLRVVASPYRDIGVPLIHYIKQHRAEHGSEVVTVYTPVYIVGHWWEGLLHNHKARRIQQKLMLVHGVTVSLVPWLLDSSELLYGRRSRPIPGQDRRGEPVRPVRRALQPGHGPAGVPGAAAAAGTLVGDPAPAPPAGDAAPSKQPGPRQTPREPGKGKNVGNQGKAARRARSAARNSPSGTRKKP